MTGYPTYNAYLKHLQQSISGFPLMVVSPREEGDESVQDFNVVDLVRDEKWVIERDLRTEKSSKTEIVDALYHPPEKSRLRVMMWNVNHASDHAIDIIGLVLGLDPRFFAALSMRVTSDAIWGTGEESRPFYTKHVVVGNSVIAFGHYKAYKNTSVPFFLIAAKLATFEFGPMDRPSIRQEIGGYPLPGHPRIHVPQSASFAHPAYEYLLQAYLELILVTLTEEETSPEGEELPLAALLAIFRLEIFRVKDKARVLRTGLMDRQLTERMYLGRELLRRWCEDTLDAIEHLSSYISREHQSEWLQHPIYQKLLNETGRSVTQATRLEAEVRDYLQIRSGAVALEETKKSIELSNHQIREGKRGMYRALD